ncbi:hypothetical protein L7F22_018123 [Adiantum nelumboides]|nr:hypothetical protein [Adiantum nelumboides]
MKSVGEVMSIGRTFEESMQKAIRSIDPQFDGFERTLKSKMQTSRKNLSIQLTNVSSLLKRFHRGYSVEKIHQLTNIDRWFLTKWKASSTLQTFSPSTTLVNFHQTSFVKLSNLVTLTDNWPSVLDRPSWLSEDFVKKNAIFPFVSRLIPSLLNSQLTPTIFVSLGFASFCYLSSQVLTATLYLSTSDHPSSFTDTSYNASEHDVSFEDQGIMVLGSGVYRIGSSVEFDWCAVRAIRTLRERGFKTVMVNYNPETVSTDYDEADRLYFENISLKQSWTSTIRTFLPESSSRWRSNSKQHCLTSSSSKRQDLGTSPEMIDMAENRYKFSRMLDKIGVDQPLWKELTSFDEAHEACARFGYPVLRLSDVSRQLQLRLPLLSTSLVPSTSNSSSQRTTRSRSSNVTSELLVLSHSSPRSPSRCDRDGYQGYARHSSRSLSSSQTFLVTTLESRYLSFSFSRLAGADPILGVEMASTGEVACFGKNKYEAYLKAMIASGLKMPTKNFLLSIGSFSEKQELLPAVRTLHALGFTLFGSSGSADFYTEQGVPVTHRRHCQKTTNGEERKAARQLTLC